MSFNITLISDIELVEIEENEQFIVEKMHFVVLFEYFNEMLNVKTIKTVKTLNNIFTIIFSLLLQNENINGLPW